MRQYVCCGMSPISTGLLRRKTFTWISMIVVLLNLAVGLYEIICGTDRLIFRMTVIVYNFGVALGLYLTTIYRVRVGSLLYAIYLNGANLLLLLLIVFLRFVLKFNAERPYRILLESIPAGVVASASGAALVYLIIVRRYIVQGIVTPVSVQREKGIESAIVLVRREYPEIFQ